MANRVTLDDIKQINIEYYNCHSYAEVSRRTGWSASTVKRYVDPQFNLEKQATKKIFNMETDMKEFDPTIFKGLDNYGELCVLSEDEITEIKELWEELMI